MDAKDNAPPQKFATANARTESSYPGSDGGLSTAFPTVLLSMLLSLFRRICRRQEEVSQGKVDARHGACPDAPMPPRRGIAVPDRTLTYRSQRTPLKPRCDKMAKGGKKAR